MTLRRISRLAIVADVVAVIVFAAIGRISHGEPDNLWALFGTAFPFLVGVGAMWAVPLVRANPVGAASAVVVWAGTVGVGLLLRAGFTDGVPPLSFTIVATLSLGVLLLGWRGLSALVAHRVQLNTPS